MKYTAASFEAGSSLCHMCHILTLTILLMVHRLHSIVWVNFGMGEDGIGGRLVGGSENGTLTVYNPEAIINSGAETIVGQSDKHTGPVRALDFNPFQVKVDWRQLIFLNNLYST